MKLIRNIFTDSPDCIEEINRAISTGFYVAAIHKDRIEMQQGPYCGYCNGTGLDAGQEVCKPCKGSGLIKGTAK